MKQSVKIMLGVCFSIVFLYLSVRNTNTAVLFNSVDRIQYRYLPLGFGGLVTSLGFRAVRWKYILRSRGTFAVGALFQYNTLGWALNFVLPAKGGELTKGVVSSQNENQPISFMTGSVIVARLLDVLVLFSFLMFGVAYLGISLPRFVTATGVGLILVLVAGIGSMWVINRYLDQIGNYFSVIVDYVRETIQSLVKGFSTIQTPQQAAIVITLSIIPWCFDAVAYYGFMRAFDITVPVITAVFFLAVTGMGLALPSSAGNIGTFQYFTILGLTTFGIARDVALGFSFFIHAMQYAVAILLGIPLLFKFSSTAVDVWKGNTEYSEESVSGVSDE